MKILHTSDWHLGSMLCGRKRYEEHEMFLSWLLKTIDHEGVDILIVAGDIFDSTTPPNRSLEQYYQFLARTAGSCCKHVIITAGNHDSPSLISAPRELCKYLNITVVGHIDENPEKMVLVLPENEEPAVIICPVPYLRDRDVRIAVPGETAGEKTTNLVSGIKNRYQEICSCAEKKRNENKNQIPIIATGHLFAAGGITREDDGSRDLYLGTLACVGADAFPASIDYLALGHLHLPQIVHGNERMRYSGAPLPMGFGEAKEKKSVLIIDTGVNRSISIREITVPVFQHIKQISGTFEDIASELTKLKLEHIPVLVEVLLDDPALNPDAHEKIHNIVEKSPVEVLRVKNLKLPNQVMQNINHNESLDTLSPEEVFIRRMDTADIPLKNRQELLESFHEIMTSLFEEDYYSE